MCLLLWGVAAFLLTLLSGSRPGFAALFFVPSCLIFGILQSRFSNESPWRNAVIGFALSFPYWIAMTVVGAYTLPSDCTVFLPTIAPVLVLPAPLIGFAIAFLREDEGNLSGSYYAKGDHHA